MKFSAIGCASIVALAAVALTAPGAVAQQTNQQLKASPEVQTVKPNDIALSERVNALQAQVNQLVEQIKSLNNQLAQVKASSDAATKNSDKVAVQHAKQLNLLCNKVMGTGCPL